MKLITIILILIVFSACGQTQIKTTASYKKISRNFEQDANALLPTGENSVDIMDQIIMSPRKQELQEKFMKGIKANPEWFMQQQKIVEQTGKELSYDPRLGLTKEEWEEYKKLMESMSDMQVVASGRAKITIIKTNQIISFKTDDEKLSSLNSTTIDIKNNTIKIFNYTLNPIDTICVTNTDNVFKSAWRGYKWEFSEPEDLTMPTTQEELANFSMKLYNFTLGLFEKTDKTYIEISGAETQQGIQITKYKIPLVFE